MSLKEDFEKASRDVKSLTTRPSNDTLLALYSLFKQATEGDASGTRPGIFDLKGRAKYDAWASKKGLPADRAMRDYITIVTSLLSK